ncbi:MAG TPA: hypothetical protein VEM96_20305 [Pyrinomonadaceae bacterium]|nr:hypothetical protein [Pyrinomonadaceae bacterium]
MTILQQYQLWIGLGFVIVLVTFSIVAFFKAKTLTPDQRAILKFLCALCAGFAGALISGDALVRIEGSVNAGTKYSVMGSIGFGLFFVVWFFFPKVVGFPPGFNFTLPLGWTFRQTVDTFANNDGAVPNYEGFDERELDAPLKAWHLKTTDTSDAIRKLRSITENPNAIRKYDVTFDDSTYNLKIRT